MSICQRKQETLKKGMKEEKNGLVKTFKYS